MVATLNETAEIAKRIIFLENELSPSFINRNAMNLTQDTIAFKGMKQQWKMTLQISWLLFFAIWGVSNIQAQKPAPKTESNSKVNVVEITTPAAKPHSIFNPNTQSELPISVGAENTASYIPLLSGKRVGIVANPTSKIGNTHLVDTLKKLGIKIVCVFAPEHGFRGDAENGAHIENGIDQKSGLTVISLYGNHVKPTAAEMKQLDVIVFDIQDVGARFYTYLTTMHYVMQACSEQNKPLIVLDRPNPNGYYIAGPILEPQFKSMVGVHPIPIVHGMTLGELANMINGEGWLRDSAHSNLKPCKLTVIPCTNYNHNRAYRLPVAPSPNLPTENSIYLYPTLCLLEGTNVSMGRGTDKPFECFGAPWLTQGTYSFTPKAIPGKSMNPPYLNETCKGVLLSDFASGYLVSYRNIYIDWMIMLYQDCPNKSQFFNSFFNKLAGNAKLQQQIISGMNSKDILQSWQPGIDAFIIKRKPYLLYPFQPELGIY
ncbi:MAG: exo-beta-N-acetylmuramidase NamZ family protein [Bacteroidia bacterium]